MQIDILSLFPKMVEGPLNESMVRIAQDKNLLRINVHNIREWTNDRHRTADDKPFGGGSGMVMKIEPVYKALVELKDKTSRTHEDKKGDTRVILLTPQGKKLNQTTVKRLSRMERLIIICGHYEGVDERIRQLVDEEISIGDYILTCGEIPACVLVDSVARFLPGVLGDPSSLDTESFEDNLLEYPQYTRPRTFEGWKVPDILLSGNHKKIIAWRKKEALKRTRQKRPDLYRKAIRKR